MRLVPASVFLALATCCAASVEAAPKGVQPTAAVFKAVTDCRGVSDSAQRLACYDMAVASIDAAEKSGDVIVADKAQVRESKKALFGFGAIKLPIFGGRDTEGTPDQIEAKIERLRDLGYGKWELTLDNGQRWRQVDDISIFPKTGQTVVIKSAAMGSYLLKVGSQRSIRAMRTQ